MLSGGIFRTDAFWFHYYDFGGSQFHRIAFLPAIVSPGEHPLLRGKRLYKTGRVDFTREVVIFPGGGGREFYYIAIVPVEHSIMRKYSFF